MHFLTKEQLERAARMRFVEVEIPELHGKVRLCRLSAAAMETYFALQKKVDAGEEGAGRAVSAHIIGSAIVNEKGEREYTPDEAYKLLDVLDTELTSRLVSEVLKLYKKPEPSAGNSEPSPSGA